MQNSCRLRSLWPTQVQEDICDPAASGWYRRSHRSALLGSFGFENDAGISERTRCNERSHARQGAGCHEGVCLVHFDDPGDGEIGDVWLNGLRPLSAEEVFYNASVNCRQSSLSLTYSPNFSPGSYVLRRSRSSGRYCSECLLLILTVNGPGAEKLLPELIH